MEVDILNSSDFFFVYILMEGNEEWILLQLGYQ